MYVIEFVRRAWHTRERDVPLPEMTLSGVHGHRTSLNGDKLRIWTDDRFLEVDPEHYVHLSDN